MQRRIYSGAANSPAHLFSSTTGMRHALCSITHQPPGPHSPWCCGRLVAVRLAGGGSAGRTAASAGIFRPAGAQPAAAGAGRRAAGRYFPLGPTQRNRHGRKPYHRPAWRAGRSVERPGRGSGGRRAEVLRASGGSCGDAADCTPTNLLYGPDSSAWSLTITPTWQKGVWFARGELSATHIGNLTAGYGFGRDNNRSGQLRALVEAGILF